MGCRIFIFISLYIFTHTRTFCTLLKSRCSILIARQMYLFTRITYPGIFQESYFTSRDYASKPSILGTTNISVIKSCVQKLITVRRKPTSLTTFQNVLCNKNWNCFFMLVFFLLAFIIHFLSCNSIFARVNL